MSLVIRIILSFVMLYFIYFETGSVTTFAIFLILLNTEVQAYLSSQAIKITRMSDDYDKGE
jgi:hypothetical protein